MQKIIPHIWFDKEAIEAAEFYTKVFKDSKINNKAKITGTPSGDCDIVSFNLSGQDFMAISAGPMFKPNPSISFMVACSTAQEVDRLWNILIQGGTALMPIDKYPFSERYGWLNDKYGVSWQIMHDGGVKVQSITPSMLFTNKVSGKAEEAMNFYCSLFKGFLKKTGIKKGHLAKYGKEQSPEKPDALMYARFLLQGQEFVIMDSLQNNNFDFNEGVSIMVNCSSQKEIDFLWDKLTADGGQEQPCGWLKDRYGVSWQITPAEINKVMFSSDQAKIDRVMKVMMEMKKIDIEKLKNA